MKKYLKDVYRRKDLLFHLLVTGLKSQHRNTYLGYAWWVLDPLLMGIIYYFLRVVVLGMTGENIGAFLIIGLVVWKWIAATINDSSKSISKKSKIITQVYLPKILFPLGSVMTQLANFTFSLAVIAIFVAVYRITPDSNLIWLPVIMLVQTIFLTALSLILGYACMFIRDIENVLTHVIRFWFYSSPVIWETSRLPEQYQFLLYYNPAAVLITSYRNIIMFQTDPQWTGLMIIGLVSLAVCCYMFYFYHLNEHKIIRAI